MRRQVWLPVTAALLFVLFLPANAQSEGEFTIDAGGTITGYSGIENRKKAGTYVRVNDIIDEKRRMR